MQTTMTNDEVISVLNTLIETCKDGEHGFNTASEGVKSDNLKTLFRDYSQQRSGYSVDLKTEVRSLGGDPDKAGSLAGTLHRGWIDIKSAITGEDEASVIAECERGEDYAVDAYEKALEQEIPASVRTLVQTQYNGVKAAHDKIRNLKQVSSAAS